MRNQYQWCLNYYWIDIFQINEFIDIMVFFYLVLFFAISFFFWSLYFVVCDEYNLFLSIGDTDLFSYVLCHFKTQTTMDVYNLLFVDLSNNCFLFTILITPQSYIPFAQTCVRRLFTVSLSPSCFPYILWVSNSRNPISPLSRKLQLCSFLFPFTIKFFSCSVHGICSILLCNPISIDSNFLVIRKEIAQHSLSYKIDIA